MSNKIEIELEQWDEIIESKLSLFNFRLKEIVRYRDLIMMFVRRDIVSMYKQTVLGPLWFFISPFLTVFVFTFVFATIAGIRTDGIPAPIFYLAGTTLWNYFQQSFTTSSATFISNAAIFGKVYFPRLIAPIASTISNLIRFVIQFSVFVLFIIYYVIFKDYHLNISLHLLLFPLLLVLMAGISFGVGIITAALTTKYRDLQLFISYGVSLLMYATPVIYPVSQVPEKFRIYLMLNPITPVIETFRYSIFGIGQFSWAQLLYSFVFMVIALFVGITLFNRVEKNFMDTV